MNCVLTCCADSSGRGKVFLFWVSVSEQKHAICVGVQTATYGRTQRTPAGSVRDIGRVPVGLKILCPFKTDRTGAGEHLLRRVPTFLVIFREILQPVET
jgi:hypothetical protein